MSTLKFPAIFIDIEGAEVSKEEGLELARTLDAAFVGIPNEAMVSILTDGLVSVMQQLGLTPTQCLALFASTVQDKSNVHVKLVRQEDLDAAQRQSPDRRPLGHSPRRRRTH